MMESRTVFAKAATILLAVLLVAFTVPLAAAAPRDGSDGTDEGVHGLGLVPSRPDPARVRSPIKLGKGAVLASAVDLSGDIPPVGDQGNQGSCVGWSTGYYYKSWHEKKEHPQWDSSDPKYCFSPSFIFNQIHVGEGAAVSDAMTLLQDTGDVDIAEFPYTDQDYNTMPTDVQVEAAKQYRIPSDWGFFFAEQTMEGPFNRGDVVTQLKGWLDSGKTLGMSIPIFQDFPSYNNNPSAQCYNYDGYSALDGGHAVFIAGYDDDVGGFLMINSWGAGWNGNGRIYLGYDFVQRYVVEAWWMNDQKSSPELSGIDPSTTGPGDTVTLTGNNLGGARRAAKVIFPGGDASVSSWKNDSVKVKVPEGATNGDVFVEDWEGSRTNGFAFSVGPRTTFATGWLLAEGATWPGFDEWVLVQNPSNEASNVALTFLTPGGPLKGPEFSVAAQSRFNVHVNDFVPNNDVSTIVTVTSGAPVCAERAMYVNAPDGKWGSHDSIAAEEVASTWYLAEGATWPGYDEWVLIMNPASGPVDVQLSFQTPDGEMGGPSLTLAGGTRGTVHVNDYAPNADVSTRVVCTTPGRGVVAERSMYVRSPDGKVDCHNSVGATEPAAGWGLAEGATWPGFEEWVLIQNPTASRVGASLYFLTPEGAYYGPAGYIDPGTRVSVRVNDYMPGCDIATIVLTDSEEEKVVVERSMYVASPDGKLGSHNATGSIYASGGWYLPEGCTLSGFDEWITVMNIDTENNAQVQLTFMTPQGAVEGPDGILPPLTRATCRVNDFISGNVSTKVESDNYVVCERAMYMDGSRGKCGAHDSLGVLASALEGGSASGSRAGAGDWAVSVSLARKLRGARGVPGEKIPGVEAGGTGAFRMK